MLTASDVLILTHTRICSYLLHEEVTDVADCKVVCIGWLQAVLATVKQLVEEANVYG